jgi:hypothetical protein
MQQIIGNTSRIQRVRTKDAVKKARLSFKDLVQRVVLWTLFRACIVPALRSWAKK